MKVRPRTDVEESGVANPHSRTVKRVARVLSIFGQRTALNQRFPYDARMSATADGPGLQAVTKHRRSGSAAAPTRTPDADPTSSPTSSPPRARRGDGPSWYRRCRRRVTRPLVAGLGALLPWPYRMLIGGVWRTSHTERRGDAALEAALTHEGGVVVAFYHENLLHTPYAMRHLRGVGLASRVDAGTLIAGILRHFDYRVIRTRKRDPAGTFRDAVAAMRTAPGQTLALAVDGPSGPRREVKPGAALMSMALDVPVFAMHVAVRRGFGWPSWDRCRVPLPFNRIVMRLDRVDAEGVRNARELTHRISRQLNATARAADAAVAVGPRQPRHEVEPRGRRA